MNRNCRSVAIMATLKIRLRWGEGSGREKLSSNLDYAIYSDLYIVGSLYSISRHACISLKSLSKSLLLVFNSLIFPSMTVMFLRVTLFLSYPCSKPCWYCAYSYFSLFCYTCSWAYFCIIPVGPSIMLILSCRMAIACENILEKVRTVDSPLLVVSVCPQISSIMMGLNLLCRLIAACLFRISLNLCLVSRVSSLQPQCLNIRMTLASVWPCASIVKTITMIMTEKHKDMIQNMTLILIGSFDVFSLNLGSGDKSFCGFATSFTIYYSLFLESSLDGISSYLTGVGFLYSIGREMFYWYSDIKFLSTFFGANGDFLLLGSATLEAGAILVSSLNILRILGRKLGCIDTSLLKLLAWIDWFFRF